jgi:hypothetical protein
VIGTDLSAIQPEWCVERSYEERSEAKLSRVPPNCQFVIEDAEDEWTFQPNSFDFIHNRNFVCSIIDWPKLIKKSFAAVKPGAG